MQPGNHVIHPTCTSLSLGKIGVVDPVVIGSVLAAVVLLNVQHVGVVDVLGYFLVLQLHLVNVFTHLVHSSS